MWISLQADRDDRVRRRRLFWARGPPEQPRSQNPRAPSLPLKRFPWFGPGWLSSRLAWFSVSPHSVWETGQSCRGRLGRNGLQYPAWPPENPLGLRFGQCHDPSYLHPTHRSSWFPLFRHPPLFRTSQISINRAVMSRWKAPGFSRFWRERLGTLRSDAREVTLSGFADSALAGSRKKAKGTRICHWLLVIGYWLLVISYPLLVTGYWSLVIGYWWLVIWH